jgi:hypothetical protein
LELLIFPASFAGQGVLNNQGYIELDQPIRILSPSPTMPLVDWPFFVRNTTSVHGGFIDKKYIYKYMKICKIGAMLIFLAGFTGQGVLNKDPIVWLHGARPTHKNFIAQSNNAFG